MDAVTPRRGYCVVAWPEPRINRRGCCPILARTIRLGCTPAPTTVKHSRPSPGISPITKVLLPSDSFRLHKAQLPRWKHYGIRNYSVNPHDGCLPYPCFRRTFRRPCLRIPSTKCQSPVGICRHRRVSTRSKSLEINAFVCQYLLVILHIGTPAANNTVFHSMRSPSA